MKAVFFLKCPIPIGTGENDGGYLRILSSSIDLVCSIEDFQLFSTIDPTDYGLKMLSKQNSTVWPH